MSYLPLLIIGLLGVILFVAAMTLPRRRTRQAQTIDRDPVPELDPDEEPPGSRPAREHRGQP